MSSLISNLNDLSIECKIGVNRLKAIESLDSLKLAKTLEKGLQSSGRQLDVMIQINTSQEDSESPLSLPLSLSNT